MYGAYDYAFGLIHKTCRGLIKEEYLMSILDNFLKFSMKMCVVGTLSVRHF